jgi:two-component system, chemotaxis family, response regulator Rcp1
MSAQAELLCAKSGREHVECRRQILIVEDNPGDVRLMREALREIDPPVTLEIATDADEALAYLTAQKESGGTFPSLIFLDFNLPKAGSRDLLRQLKNDERLRVIPVAVLTTSDAERDIRDAYELHANCYLRKPVDLDGFFSTIRSAANFWLNVASAAADIRGGAGK